MRLRHAIGTGLLCELALGLALSLAFAGFAAAQARQEAPAAPVAAEPEAPAPAQPDFMPVEQVRIGMRGYGLTVFHGTKIEPFPVEVISIEHNFVPRQSVIWVRCPSERMQKSGPVQGMSGSPIYLWADGEAQEPGVGGRLIGAFAFGFAATKDCYVGVQPIEQMRDIAQRAVEQPDDDAQARPQAQMHGRAEQTLAALLSAAEEQAIAPAVRWRLQALAQASPKVQAPSADNVTRLPRGPRALADAGETDGAQRMLLPMAVGSPSLVSLTGPLLRPLGLEPRVAGPQALAGRPPAGINVEDVQFAPGSVLAIPLAFGDMDLSASGTVTDVLPDGRVLAFGHAMFGQGDVALPMATGFVHMVLPQLITSFKLGGSGVIRGAVVRDENAGIVGRPDGTFKTAILALNVNLPRLEPTQYNYQVVQHRQLGPVLAGIVSAYSMTARQGMPEENTLRLRGTMRFASQDGEELQPLQLDSIIPGAMDRDLFIEIVAPLAGVIQNPFESVRLQSMELEIDVEPVLRVATVASARLLQSEVAPGEKLGISLRLQPYGQPMERKVVEITIPDSLPEGEYNIMVADAATYFGMVLGSRPHLMTITDIDELLETIQQILSVKNDALYVLLELPREGLAVGRQELPSLPSSRRVMIATPTSTLATPYMEFAEVVVPTERVVSGQLMFTVTVRKKHGQHRDEEAEAER